MGETARTRVTAPGVRIYWVLGAVVVLLGPALSGCRLDPVLADTGFLGGSVWTSVPGAAREQATAASSHPAANGLASLVLEGRELHPSLVTRRIDDETLRHVPRSVVQRNPQHSTDPEFIEAIARGGSQGNLGGAGVRSALYALYLGDNELGFYGLEAASAADANRLEDAIRSIWAHNARVDRARVHQDGLVLVVVWTDGLSPEVWAAVNAAVSDRLIAP